MNKRGQIVFAIIAGVVLLLGAGLYFFASNTVFEEQVVAPEFVPIKNFVETCAQEQLRAATTLIASQGGYLYLPDQIRFDPFASIELLPGSPFKIPLWYHNNEDRVPTKANMSRDISQFIAENIRECLDYSSFENQFIIKEGPLRVSTAIEQEKVIAQLNYPISIQARNSDTIEEISLFRAETNARLGELHDLASEIMRLENTQQFLEQTTMDMIAIADLPLEGTDFRCGKRSWSTQFEIKPHLQKILKYNFREFRFDGTEFEETDVPYFQSFFTLPLADQYDDVRVNTVYEENYGMQLDVDPSSGDTVESFDMDIPIIGSCMQIYHHFYSMEYPVMFELYDESSDEPFVFRFATPVLIKNNQPERRRDITLVSETDDSRTSSFYCAQAEHELKVFVEDKITGETLADAELSYECAQFTCDIGKTEIPTFEGVPLARSNPNFIGDFPPCTNGFLVANREGYQEGFKQITLGNNQEEFLTTVELIPLFNYSYTFRVLETTGGSFSLRNLKEDESVYVFITSDEHDFRKTLIFPSDVEQFSTLELLGEDANYTVDVKLLVDDLPVGGHFYEWEVTRPDLLGTNQLAFTVFAPSARPQNLDQFGDFWVNTIIPNSEQFPPVIR